jgi:hypothetical protein
MQRNLSVNTNQKIENSRAIHLTKKERLYGLKMVHFYRRHPVLAVRDILGLPVTAPHLRIAIRAAWFCDHAVLMLSRGMLKSTVIAIISVLKSILYPNRVQLVLGPQFRQGRMIFEDAGIEKIVTDKMGKQEHRLGFSNQSCTSPNKVIYKGNNDIWRVTFKNMSRIITGPLGKKGDSLLGTRANDIRLDEMRDFTKYQITKVIHPFANVLADPFTNAGDLENFEGNTFMYCGTIRYTDDYYYEIIKEYRDYMERDKDFLTYGFCPRIKRGKYCVIEFNYEDAFQVSDEIDRPKQFTAELIDDYISKGYLRFFFRINVEDIEAMKYSDTVNIEDWFAENKNFPIKLGSKEFPYILLQKISDDVEFTDKNMPNAKYLFPEYLKEAAGFCGTEDFAAPLEPLLSCDEETVMGVDVATESDKFAITIIKPGSVQGNTFDHIVYAFTKAHMTYKEMPSKIYECFKKYNTALIYIDKRGGGTALRDLLREPEDKACIPLIDLESDEKAKFVRNGLNIIRMVNATAEYNTIMANNIKVRMQSNRLLMPKLVSIHPNDEKDIIYKDLLSLRNQFGKVISATVGAGWKKYYIPETKSTDPSLDKGYKDLFSSTLYAMDALLEYCGEKDKKRDERFAGLVPKVVTMPRRY